MTYFRNFLYGQIVFTFLFVMVSNAESVSDSVTTQSIGDDSVKVVALEMMREMHYCALITLDETGMPQVRTMNPYPQEDDFVIWFATKRNSRKVMEIKNDSRVSVYYANHEIPLGYVVISGSAEIIDDKEIVINRKRDYWEGNIKDWEDELVLIKIIPDKLDIVNYKHGLSGNPETWRSPSIELKNN